SMLEALTIASRARSDNIVKKAHFVGHRAHSDTSFTAPATLRVEREARGVEAFHTGERALREQLADLVPNAEERGGHGAGGAPDGGLVHRQCTADRFPPHQAAMRTSGLAD